jgi:hypothetical protein
VDEAELMHSFDSENTLGHIKPRDVLREGVVLDEHGHQVASGKELHDEVEICRILERVEELDHPCGVGFGQNISFGANVGELNRAISIGQGSQEWQQRA